MIMSSNDLLLKSIENIIDFDIKKRHDLLKRFKKNVNAFLRIHRIWDSS